MTHDEMDDKLTEMQIAVLALMSPDEWHVIADIWNWDERLNVLYWIVSQPECDRSTARLLFWKGLPSEYDWQNCEEAMGDDPYAVAPMLAHIVSRFRSDGFPRSELEFDFYQARAGNYEEGVRAYTKTVVRRLAALFGRFERINEPYLGSRSAVPYALQIFYCPGRRVSKLSLLNGGFSNFPIGVNYGTGELVYFD